MIWIQGKRWGALAANFVYVGLRVGLMRGGFGVVDVNHRFVIGRFSSVVHQRGVCWSVPLARDVRAGSTVSDVPPESNRPAYTLLW